MQQSRFGNRPNLTGLLSPPTKETVTYSAGTPELSTLCSRYSVLVDPGLSQIKCHEKDTFIGHEDKIKRLASGVGRHLALDA